MEEIAPDNLDARHEAARYDVCLAGFWNFLILMFLFPFLASLEFRLLIFTTVCWKVLQCAVFIQWFTEIHFITIRCFKYPNLMETFEAVVNFVILL